MLCDNGKQVVMGNALLREKQHSGSMLTENLGSRKSLFTVIQIPHQTLLSWIRATLITLNRLFPQVAINKGFPLSMLLLTKVPLSMLRFHYINFLCSVWLSLISLQMKMIQCVDINQQSSQIAVIVTRFTPCVNVMIYVIKCTTFSLSAIAR